METWERKRKHKDDEDSRNTKTESTWIRKRQRGTRNRDEDHTEDLVAFTSNHSEGNPTREPTDEGGRDDEREWDRHQREGWIESGYLREDTGDGKMGRR